MARSIASQLVNGLARQNAEQASALAGYRATIARQHSALSDALLALQEEHEQALALVDAERNRAEQARQYALGILAMWQGQGERQGKAATYETLARPAVPADHADTRPRRTGKARRKPRAPEWASILPVAFVPSGIPAGQDPAAFTYRAYLLQLDPDMVTRGQRNGTWLASVTWQGERYTKQASGEYAERSAYARLILALGNAAMALAEEKRQARAASRLAPRQAPAERMDVLARAERMAARIRPFTAGPDADLTDYELPSRLQARAASIAARQWAVDTWRKATS